MTAEATDSRSKRIARALPLRLAFEPGDSGTGHERVITRPFRLGFGEDCDIRLQGGNGPDVVFEVERARGPLLIASAVPPEEFEHYIDLKINGEPLRGPMQELAPGTRLEITDRAARRRYRLVLDPTRRNRLIRPRNLAVLMAVLAIIGGGFGAYLYGSLRGTQSELARTSERIEQAEAEFARTAQNLLDSVSRMGGTDAELAKAIHDLGQLQTDSSQEIKGDFARRLADLNAQTREALARIAAQDSERRAQLAAGAQTRLDALRGEFSARMVESYQQLKDLEQKLLTTMAQRFADRQPALADLKRVLATSREAVLFIRTTYDVRFGDEKTVTQLNALGTGFVVDAGGLAVSAQHVMFPWRYDQKLLVLGELGLAQVVPDSVRWSIWPAGVRVLTDPADDESYDESSALRPDSDERGMRMLVAPERRMTPTVVSSPIGLVEIPLPIPGPTDVAVFQIMALDAGRKHLPVRTATSGIDALDEVLVLGYPYSRLEDGQAWPQGVRGFIRRVGDELLEIDAAVHPGLSGGPLIDAGGAVIGMITAIIGSEVYGTAVRSEDLHAALDLARDHVRAEEERLAALGCKPGVVDGVFERETWDAYRCERERSQD